MRRGSCAAATATGLGRHWCPCTLPGPGSVQPRRSSSGKGRLGGGEVEQVPSACSCRRLIGLAARWNEQTSRGFLQSRLLRPGCWPSCLAGPASPHECLFCAFWCSDDCATCWSGLVTSYAAAMKCCFTTTCTACGARRSAHATCLSLSASDLYNNRARQRHQNVTTRITLASSLVCTSAECLGAGDPLCARTAWGTARQGTIADHEALAN